MGDKVRGVIEAMVWDLRAMENKGYFEEEEIREILKIRENHEYAMNKFTSTPLEYLKAIEYEMRLEELRNERFAELEFKKMNDRDYSIVKRVIFLFDRLCARFKYNPVFWKQYMRFCIQNESKKNFYRVSSNALRFNSNDLDLWEICIYYEFEIRKNPFKSRKMFMKCLRVNNNSLEAWIRYLRFESRFIKLIEKRENLLEDDEKEEEEGNINGKDEEFLTFDGGDEEKYQNLLASSDEEEDDKEIELSMKKSNHKLILVIVESIMDNFGESYETYSGVIKTLREESEDSVEIKLARKAIFREVKQGGKIKKEQIVKLVALNRGIFKENLKLSLEKIEKFVKDYRSLASSIVLKVLSGLLEGIEDQKNENLRDIEDDIKLLGMNLIDRITLKELQKVSSEELELILDQFFDEKSEILNKEILSFIEENKLRIGFLGIYLSINQNRLSDMGKLDYLDLYLKNLDKEFDVDTPSFKKREIKAEILTKVVQHIFKKIKTVFTLGKNTGKNAGSDSESDDSDLDEDYLGSSNGTQVHEKKLKIFSIYATRLIKACNFDKHLIDSVGGDLQSIIFENLSNIGEKSQTQGILEIFCKKFLALQKLCPLNLLVYFLENSKTFNKEADFETALAYYPQSLTLWRMRFEFAFLSKDLGSLQLLYNRALESCSDRNGLMKMYKQVIGA